MQIQRTAGRPVLQELAAQRMIFSKDQQQPFFLDRFRDNALRQLGNDGIHDGKIHPAVFEEHDEVTDQKFSQMEFHVGMLRKKSGKDCRQQKRSAPGTNAQCQLLQFFIVQIGLQFFFQIMAVFQIMVVDFSCRSQFQRDLRAVKELTAQ